MASSPYSPDRRPIASRDRAAAKTVATILARARVSPNAISIAGMVAGLGGGAALAFTSHTAPAWPWFLLGAAMMQARLLANMFDGMVALQSGKASPVGSLFNEIPDRVSDAAFFIGMGYAAGGIPELGYWAAITAVMTAYVRAEGRVAGAPQEYCGPMAKPHRMALATIAAILAAVLPQDWTPRLSVAPDAGIMALALMLIACGGLVTILRRLARIAAALRGITP